jgi:uncharacterized membrane protein YfcA
MPATPTPLLIVLFAVACFVTGFSKAGFGGSLGFFITPMLALVMPLQSVVGLMLPVLMLGDFFALIANWRNWITRLFWLMLVGALAGIALAAFVLANTPADALRKGLAIFIWIFVAYKLLEKRLLDALRYRPQSWHAPLAGWVGGLASTLANAGGTPITAFLLLQDLSPAAFVGTSVIFFTIVNWIKLPFFLAEGFIDLHLLLRLSWLLLLVPFGAWVGKKVVNRVNRAVFDNLVLGILVISSILLLI